MADVTELVERGARVAAPVALALFVVVGVVLSDQSATVALVAGALVVTLGALLAAGSVTGWPLALGLAAAGVGVEVICNANPANLGWFAVCVLVGWCSFAAAAVPTLVLGAAYVGMLATQWLLVSDEPGWGAWIAGTVFTALACLMARRQGVLVEQLRTAQAGLADRTRAEERARIAREMHDVIGHALTVSLLHVSSARLALDDDPAEARASLDEAERLARQSLAEVRAAVGLMREPGGTTPLPGAAELEELVASFRRAGTEVTYVVTGDPSALGATEGLTVYRILQEALTNAARHAPGATASVRLDLHGDTRRLLVANATTHATTDATTTGTTTPPPDGHGLTGMRERAAAVGGTLSAGPWRDGWRVEAVLPR